MIFFVSPIIMGHGSHTISCRTISPWLLRPLSTLFLWKHAYFSWMWSFPHSLILLRAYYLAVTKYDSTELVEILPLLSKMGVFTMLVKVHHLIISTFRVILQCVIYFHPKKTYVFWFLHSFMVGSHNKALHRIRGDVTRNGLWELWIFIMIILIG